MLTLIQTRTFKKCIKQYQHNKLVLTALKKVVALLVNNQSIAVSYRDHALKSDHKGIRELHLKPDELLLYKKDEEKVILMALGSHAEIF